MDNFQIEDEDEIFFGLPEEEEDFSGIDYLWDQDESELEKAAAFEAPTSTSASTANRPKAKKRTAKAKKISDKPRLQCPHCTKTYATERTLKTHLNTVVLKDLASKAPDLQDLFQNMHDLCLSALAEVQSALTVGELAENCSSYCSQLADFMKQHDSTLLLEFLSNHFNQEFKFPSVVCLSNLRETVTIATNRLLNASDFRKQLKELCDSMVQCSQMQNRAYSQESGPKKRSTDNFKSPNFKKIVHYIGGSVVCGINRRRKNYPTAIPIKNFASVMNETFVEDMEDPTTCCDPEVKEWTNAQDRGGLVHLSKNAFEFFLALIAFVMCHEEEDGSVLLVKVNSAVAKNFDLIRMWDLLVGASIEEDRSLEWLVSVVEIVCRCVSKGIIKRRLNDALKKPVSSVAHRSKLAR